LRKLCERDRPRLEGRVVGRAADQADEGRDQVLTIESTIAPKAAPMITPDREVEHVSRA
jgi:hypothetical protein